MAQPSDLQLNIPALNGPIVAWMSSAIEHQLSEDKLLLTVDIKDTLAATINATIIRLSIKLLEQGVSAPDGQLLCTAAYVLLSTGNIGWDGQRPDGDWVPAVDATPCELPDKARVYFARVQDLELQRTAIALVVGTKINFFQENHHVGQRGQDGGHHIREVIQLHFPNGNVEQILDTACTIGHWASTRTVLGQLGMAVRVSRPVFAVPYANRLQAVHETELRIISNPAGTEMHRIANELFKKMICHPLAAFTPSINDYCKLAATVNAILQDPALYHIQHVYLTGHEPPYSWSDSNAFGLLGRVGSYGAHFMASSTLMQSRLVKDGAYKNAPDYDPQFDQMMSSFKLTPLGMQKKVLEELCSSFTVHLKNYESACSAYKRSSNLEVLEAIQKYGKYQ